MKLSTLAVAVALAFGLAACDSGDKSKTSSSPPSSSPSAGASSSPTSPASDSTKSGSASSDSPKSGSASGGASSSLEQRCLALEPRAAVLRRLEPEQRVASPLEPGGRRSGPDDSGSGKEEAVTGFRSIKQETRGQAKAWPRLFSTTPSPASRRCPAPMATMDIARTDRADALRRAGEQHVAGMQRVERRCPIRSAAPTLKMRSLVVLASLASPRRSL